VDVIALKESVAAALEPLDIRAYMYRKNNPVPPCAMILLQTSPPQETMGGFRRPLFQVRLAAPFGNPEAAEQMIDTWLSTDTTGSVLDALAAITTANLSSPDISQIDILNAADGSVMLVADLTFDIF
jgi:hypothetical protein